MLRAIDKFVDFDGLRRHLMPLHSTTGNVYTCPGGKLLTTRGTIVNDDQVLYRASKFDCTTCTLKVRCCPKEPVRKIPRSVYERSREVARSLVGTKPYEQSRRERKKIEMLFAHLKRIIGLRRLRLRGPSGAKDEFLLAATAQNLRKLAKVIIPTMPQRLATA